MNDALKKPEKYRKRYMRSHKIMTMILDNEKDADILAWLDGKENKSEAVRELIRKEAKNA
jgi:hypothetical protein